MLLCQMFGNKYGSDKPFCLRSDGTVKGDHNCKWHKSYHSVDPGYGLAVTSSKIWIDWFSGVTIQSCFF